jgi:hypothetical protein
MKKSSLYTYYARAGFKGQPKCITWILILIWLIRPTWTNRKQLIL